MGAGAEALHPVAGGDLDVGDGGGVGALAERVFGVVREPKVSQACRAERVLERVDRPVARSLQPQLLAVAGDGEHPVHA